MLVWLLSIVIGFLSPIIFMIVSRDKEFVYRNTMQCLTFHILLAIIWFVLPIVGTLTCGIGFILIIVPLVAQLVVPIIGAITANNGAVYEPPISSQLCRAWFKV